MSSRNVITAYVAVNDQTNIGEMDRGNLVYFGYWGHAAQMGILFCDFGISMGILSRDFGINMSLNFCLRVSLPFSSDVEPHLDPNSNIKLKQKRKLLIPISVSL